MKQMHIILLMILIVAVITAIRSLRKKESGYSPAEYSNYPNLTGNPVADIAILNQAGFRADHS